MKTTDFRPSRHHEALLRAAFLKGGWVQAAFQEWKAMVDIHALDGESYRWLPKLYRNLRAHELDDPLMPRLRGIYRKTWYSNQFKIRRLTEALEALHTGGVETVILNGSVLATRYYNDDGACPVDDLDVLVRPERVRAAIALLQGSGWMPAENTSRPLGGNLDSIRPVCFESRHGVTIGLHSHVLDGFPEASGTDSGADLWNAVMEIGLSERKVYALNPADQLLYVCAQELLGGVRPPMRWVADAIAVLQNVSMIQWDRLVTQSRKRDTSVAVADMLDYLHDVFDIEVAQDVLRRLRVARTVDAPRAGSPTRSLISLESVRRVHLARRLLWRDYLRFIERSQPGVSPRSFLRFLKHHWGAQSVWRLPFFAGLRLRWVIQPGREPEDASV
jgi:hypothetical protein